VPHASALCLRDLIKGDDRIGSTVDLLVCKQVCAHTLALPHPPLPNPLLTLSQCVIFCAPSSVTARGVSLHTSLACSHTRTRMHDAHAHVHARICQQTGVLVHVPLRREEAHGLSYHPGDVTSRQVLAHDTVHSRTTLIAPARHAPLSSALVPAQATSSAVSLFPHSRRPYRSGWARARGGGRDEGGGGGGGLFGDVTDGIHELGEYWATTTTNLGRTVQQVTANVPLWGEDPVGISRIMGTATKQPPTSPQPSGRNKEHPY